MKCNQMRGDMVFLHLFIPPLMAQTQVLAKVVGCNLGGANQHRAYKAARIVHVSLCYQ